MWRTLSSRATSQLPLQLSCRSGRAGRLRGARQLPRLNQPWLEISAVYHLVRALGVKCSRGEHPVCERRIPGQVVDRERGASNVANAGVILSHQRVRCQEGDTFNKGLRNKDPIEWVLVQRWEPSDLDRVLAGDRQFLIAIVEQAPPPA